MILRHATLGLLCLTLTACTGYRHSFDCPPEKGIGCRSVSYIESRIIERDEGPDEFAPPEDKKDKKCKKRCAKENSSVRPAEPEQERVWVAGSEDTPGHYVYFKTGTGQS